MNLPQGWHSVPDSTKQATNVSVSSVPVIIRKKWNSPMSNVPQTKLPSYKSSNLRLQNKQNLNDAYQNKPKPTNSTNTQSKPPSLIKEYQKEIDKLKKDLTTLKAENSILKAKVRRVDDENLQKGRQMEKMRAEIKTLQKIEAVNLNKKNKESQELHYLRQKCVGLESSIKEKDITIKRLIFESAKHEKPRSTKPLVQKQISSVIPARNTKSAPSTSEREFVTDKSSHSRVNIALKTEVAKLQAVIHKLEKENLDLQQQAKIHSQEIRNLKVQLKSKDKVPVSQTFLSRSSVQGVKDNRKVAYSVLCNGDGKHVSNSNLNSTVSMQRPTKSPFANSILIRSAKSVLQETNTIGSYVKTKNPQIMLNGKVGHPIRNKQTKFVASKLPTAKPISKPRMTKPLTRTTEKMDVEKKVQEMRENIAAKKIQRSWREHRKNVLDFKANPSKNKTSEKDKLQVQADRYSVDNEEVTVE